MSFCCRHLVTLDMMKEQGLFVSKAELSKSRPSFQAMATRENDCLYSHFQIIRNVVRIINRSYSIDFGYKI